MEDDGGQNEILLQPKEDVDAVEINFLEAMEATEAGLRAHGPGRVGIILPIPYAMKPVNSTNVPLLLAFQRLPRAPGIDSVQLPAQVEPYGYVHFVSEQALPRKGLGHHLPPGPHGSPWGAHGDPWGPGGR